MTLTPEQFNLLATKEDLKNFRTKDEIDGKFNQIENRFSKLETKLDSLSVSHINTNQRVERIEEKVDALVDSMSDVLTSLDGVAKGLNDMKHEFATNLGAHDRFEERITKIEKKLNPNPAF